MKTFLGHPTKRIVIYDGYWRFAAARQSVFEKRLKNYSAPWTTDCVLKKYRFTNTYRACDRVSQYLIRNIIYSGNYDEEDMIFRILLFKLFNKIDTWKLLENTIGDIIMVS
jgi:hypothetical protein